MTYKPKPLDTEHIVIAQEIESILERIAENVHDCWAKKRIDEGWKYGHERNDEEKIHPCLVAYEMLPDSEKEYDRTTAKETIRTLLALGFQIKNDSDSS